MVDQQSFQAKKQCCDPHPRMWKKACRARSLGQRAADETLERYGANGVTVMVLVSVLAKENARL